MTETNKLICFHTKEANVAELLYDSNKVLGSNTENAVEYHSFILV